MNNKDVVSNMKYHFFKKYIRFLGGQAQWSPKCSWLLLCTSSHHQDGGRPRSVMIVVDDTSLFCRGGDGQSWLLVSTLP